MLGINMFGIFAGINVHFKRLKNFKPNINKFMSVFDFNIVYFLIYLRINIGIFMAQGYKNREK